MLTIIEEGPITVPTSEERLRKVVGEAIADYAKTMPQPRITQHPANGNGSAPRWRVLIELLIVAGISALIVNALNDREWKTAMNLKVQQLQEEVHAIADKVKPIYRGLSPEENHQ